MTKIKNLINLHNIKILGILFCIFFILFNASIVLDYPKNMSSINNIDLLANEFLESHQLIFHITLVFLIFSVFSKTLKPIHIIFTVIIGGVIFSFRLLDEHLHDFLVNNNIYPISFKHGGTQVNPQYTKLLLFLIFIPILFMQNLYKKHRTKLKSFSLLGVSAILFTVFIFHNVVPKGSLEYQKEEQLKDINTFFQLTPSTQQELCKIKYKCYIIKNYEEFYEISNKYNISQSRVNNFLKNNQFQDSLISGTFDKNGRFKILSVGYNIVNAKDILAIFVVEENKTMYAQNLSEIQFSYLSIYANTFWLLFCWFLIWMHNSKWRFQIFQPNETNSIHK